MAQSGSGLCQIACRNANPVFIADGAPRNRRSRWAKLPIAGVLTAWWITFLVSTIGLRAAVATIGEGSFESLRNSDWAAIASCLVAVASCVLGIISVRALTARQHRRAAA
jgi:hypothetical protein